MKVCTDACIQGAWTSLNIPQSVNSILDIGTGTGLLSLMLAQNSQAKVTAIEIDQQTSDQAAENFSISSWSERMEVFNIALRDFESGNNYDVIICNPPFYENDLQSPDGMKNAAMHSTTLALKELIEKITALLSPDGVASLLLPVHRYEHLLVLLDKSDLFILKQLNIKQSSSHEVFRIVVLFSRNTPDIKTEEELIIKNDHVYSESFKDLMRDYYLKL